MCIIFIKTNNEPKKGEFRLIIASNRDEFYKRPAREAFLCKETGIIGGRDLEETRENGMWLGLKQRTDQSLRFSCLLNVSGEEGDENAHSRGFIVPNYLNSAKSSIDYFEDLTKDKKHRPFNLINIELNKQGVCTYFLSNTPEQMCKFTGAQTVAFGNSPVSRPYLKVTNGRFKFEEILNGNATKDEIKSALIKFLKSKEKHLPDPEIEIRRPGIVEHIASIFVECNRCYGTRTHTIIMVDFDWNVEFHEETMEFPIDPDNIKWKNNTIKIAM